MFLPLASTIAYAVVELLPRFRNHRHVRTARATIEAKLDPERELRAAREQLDIALTPANRLRVADALAELERHGEALPYYRESIGASRADVRTGEKYARSLFETDQPQAALDALDAMKPPTAQSDRDRVGLLRGAVLDDLGRTAEAEAIYADVVTRLPGDEARCRYAGLLLREKRIGEARKILEQIEARVRRIDRSQRAASAQMYRWAEQELARLRQAGG